MDKNKKPVNKDDKGKSDNDRSVIKQLNELKLQLEDYKNKYLRALADYQNLEKRVNEEKQNLIEIGQNELIIKFLAIIDNLEKAEIFVKDAGLRHIKDQFYRLLKSLAVEEIQVLNKPFDPSYAEAVDLVKGDQDNQVVEVVKKGYRRGKVILRVAQVKVSKK